jgi:hypothetical protein
VTNWLVTPCHSRLTIGHIETLSVLSCNRDVAEIVLREAASDFFESPLHAPGVPAAEDDDSTGDEAVEEEDPSEGDTGKDSGAVRAEEEAVAGARPLAVAGEQ